MLINRNSEITDGNSANRVQGRFIFPAVYAFSSIFSTSPAFAFVGLTGENLHLQKVTPVIAELLELCWKHYRNTDIENLRLCGLALASYCIAKLPEGLLRKNETVDYRIARLCSNIEGLYREETSIRRMVKISGMGSKSTLMRNFRKATGTTPHQFLIKSKYAYGAELLTTTQYTIGEICEMIGENNQFLFSRVFKKIYGVPPSRYRKID